MTAGDLRARLSLSRGDEAPLPSISRARSATSIGQSQPRPFRSFEGASSLGFLARSGEPTATTNSRAAGSHRRVGTARDPEISQLRPAPFAPPIEGAAPHPRDTLGHFLRYALGLSREGVSRVALVVCASILRAGISTPRGVCHRSALSAISTPGEGQGAEATARLALRARPACHRRRGVFAADACRRWRSAADGRVLVALHLDPLARIVEVRRARVQVLPARSCHAVAALSLSAALLGWRRDAAVVVAPRHGHDRRS